MSIALLTRPVPAVSGGYRYTSRGLVDASMLDNLRQRGIEDPICSVKDPRLDYPELLLLDGFRWESTDNGSRYIREVEDNPGCQQVVEFCANHVRKVTTRCGGRFQELTLHPDGTCIEVHR